eukprot:2845364-Lingulodinium_polyedra.AAC.1
MQVFSSVEEWEALNQDERASAFSLPFVVKTGDTLKPPPGSKLAEFTQKWRDTFPSSTRAKEKARCQAP